MIWPDSWYLGLLLDMGWAALMNLDGVALLVFAALLSPLLLLWYWFVWPKLAPKLVLQGGRAEIGRVAWVVGDRTGILQAIWYRHGWLCNRHPSVWRYGYGIAATYWIGAAFLFSMNYWRIFWQIWFDIPSAGYEDWGAPWPVLSDHPLSILIQIAVGLAARLFLLLGLWWFVKTWVVKGWPGSRWTDNVPILPTGYAPWPGNPPQSPEGIDYTNSRALPIGWPEINRLGGVIYYVWPRHTRGYWFNPLPVVLPAPTLSTNPVHISLASHLERLQHPLTGREYRTPSERRLASSPSFGRNIAIQITQSLEEGRRGVEEAVRTSAETATRKQLEDYLATSPAEECFIEVDAVAARELSEHTIEEVMGLVKEFNNALLARDLQRKSRAAKAINQAGRDIFGIEVRGITEPGAEIADVPTGRLIGFKNELLRRIEEVETDGIRREWE